MDRRPRGEFVCSAAKTTKRWEEEHGDFGSVAALVAVVDALEVISVVAGSRGNKRPPLGGFDLGNALVAMGDALGVTSVLDTPF